MPVSRLIFSAMLGAATLSSCLTDEAVPEPKPEVCPPRPGNELLSRWNWQQSSGGIAGGTQTPAGTGQQRAIEFDANGTVRYYTNGQLTRTNSYTLQTGTSIRTRQSALIIQYGNDALRQSVTVDGAQLTLWDEAYDGFQHNYKQ